MLNDINYSGGNTSNYSTTEHIVGTWIDDSILYEKTLVINNLASGAYRTVSHGITSPDIIFVKEGFAVYTPSGTNNPTSAILSSYNSSVGAEEFLGAVSYDDFGYRCGADLGGGTAYITIRYTKSS